jgi:hypothetical protein
MVNQWFMGDILPIVDGGAPPMDGPRVSEAMATGGTVPERQRRRIWDGEHLGCSSQVEYHSWYIEYTI